LDILRRRIELRAVEYIGDEPAHDDQRRLPRALDAQLVGMPRAPDQQRPREERDQRPAQQHRTVRTPEVRLDRERHEHRRGAGDHQEAHDAEVEQSAIAELDIEPERDQRIGDRLSEEQRDVLRPLPQPDKEDEDHQAHIGQHRAAGRAHVEAPLKMPFGRLSRVMTRITNATVSLYSGGTSDSVSGNVQPFGRYASNGLRTAVQLNTASASAKPISIPPAMAPYVLPRPPTIAAAKIGRMMLKARSGLRFTSSASIVPARQASAPAMIQVTITTSCVLMPETCARSGLSDIARMPLPNRERVRK